MPDIRTTKAMVEDGVITRVGLPSTYTRPDGTYVSGGYQNLPDSIHFVDGWRDLITPVYNSETQYLSNRHYDSDLDYCTWDVVDKTEAQLASEQESVLSAKDNELDILAIKRLLQTTTIDVLNSESITEQNIEDLKAIYPQWRIGKVYAIDDVVVCDSILYKVIQVHTSQSDWLPADTPSLYTAYRPAGQVSDWVQPTGSSDAYQTGEQVRFNGSVYVSLIDANVWSPTAYPAGWQLIE